ncbi:MAG TPA: D-alanyl-D-alanine carboxypeptidase [Ohtaekwangia sp.]|nr:D-alanyl-D-alanine carboxypeptidase [Ohtaekwangia sp.]
MRIGVIAFLIFITGCAPVAHQQLTETFQKTEKKFQDHTGFVIYDPEKDETVFDYNGAAYFTPASNTKILTLFASLLILGDSIPGIEYLETEDSLIFWGTGDPSFQYKETFSNNRVLDFLQQQQKALYFSNSNFHTAHFGSGWAWDDYNSSYSAERSPFPIYGNCFFVYPFTKDVYVWPWYFKSLLSVGENQEETKVIRDPFSNNTMYYPGLRKRKNEWKIPFRVDQQLITELLSDTLQRKVQPVMRQKPSDIKTLYSVPSDSLYKTMMQESDNLIAEQLLMMCSNVLSDSLQPEIAIKWMQKNRFEKWPDKVVWVDGSGLSRYNLITPRSVVELWKQIAAVVPRERLFKIIAVGGKPGTLKNWYIADQPYVFGKTGTLSNTHALSGFLVTKSGKTLIFSFMNANFTASMNEIRHNMQRILNSFYEKY